MKKEGMTALALGGGLLGLGAGLSVLNRFNRSSRAMLKAHDAMQSEKGWNPDKFKGDFKSFINFLGRLKPENKKTMIRSYVNYADEILGDTLGNLGANLYWGKETFKWLRERGLWRLPKEMRGKMPVDSTNPAWNAKEAPGRLVHFRELGGKGKVRSFRHWFIESKTKSMKNFSGLNDANKKLVNKLDDDIARMKSQGLNDNDTFEHLLNQDWLQKHLSKMVMNKADMFYPHPGGGSFLQKQFNVRKNVDSVGPIPADIIAHPAAVKAIAGGGVASLGVGGAKLYDEANKTWLEKLQDKLNDLDW